MALEMAGVFMDVAELVRGGNLCQFESISLVQRLSSQAIAKPFLHGCFLLLANMRYINV